MKKIKISTVKQTCDVQVINIDAQLVANAIKTQLNNEQLCAFIDCPPMPDAGEQECLFDECSAVDHLGRKYIAEILTKTQEFLDNLVNAFLEDDNIKDCIVEGA